VSAPHELVGRARELRDYLRERQAETEQRGGYSGETHALLLEAGFFRMLIPRRHGGLDVDLPTYAGVIGELARGCPASAWCVALLAAGALRARVLFDAEAQSVLFAEPDFRATSAVAGVVRARPDGGGFIFAGSLEGAVGARHATHLLGETGLDGGDDRLLFAAPRNRFEVADNEEHDVLRGGWDRVRFDGTRISAPLVRRLTATGETPADPWQEGVQAAALAAVFAGAASAAAEIYEQLTRSGSVRGSTSSPRRLDPDYQRWLGAAIGRASAASLLLAEAVAPGAGVPLDAGGGILASPTATLELAMLARESMKLAWSAVADVLRTAAAPDSGAQAALERIGRALMSGFGDPALPAEESVARRFARRRLGLPL
jgi:3-hydroxy-9,10-secoandrosta-1,3,5(10)-triene-9,17-dione monooxygenase